MDFVHDCLADGRPIRILTVVDNFSRESVLLECDGRMSGKRVGEPHQALCHRKNNWVFSYLPPGADASAVLYSLVETA